MMTMSQTPMAVIAGNTTVFRIARGVRVMAVASLTDLISVDAMPTASKIAHGAQVMVIASLMMAICATKYLNVLIFCRAR